MNNIFCRQDIVLFVASWSRHVFNHFQLFVCCGMVLVTSEVSQDLDVNCLQYDLHCCFSNFSASFTKTLIFRVMSLMSGYLFLFFVFYP